jgi:hypothetical protein
MVRLGIILLLLFAACHQAAAKAKPFIEIITEANTAFLGDTIVIEVRWSGLLDPIDFGPLLVNAELVRETVGTRIAVADGEVIDISSRRMELLPRQIGSVTLGPLRSGDVVSNSVTVDVTPMSSVVWRPGPDDIRLEQTISTTSPWIQQQVTLDIVLVARYPVAGEKITLPNLRPFVRLRFFRSAVPPTPGMTACPDGLGATCFFRKNLESCLCRVCGSPELSPNHGLKGRRLT